MLENYQPKKVFQYFEEICRIPHPSYHCEAISNYLMDFDGNKIGEGKAELEGFFSDGSDTVADGDSF